MGAVCSARDIATHRRVALKVLHGHRLEHAARFEREGHALATLSHPAIVQYVAHGTDDAGDPFLAMDRKRGDMKRQELAPEIADGEDRPVPLDVELAVLSTAPTDEEVQETMELVRWFTGRYPTAKERFAYVRRKYAEWTRNPPARGAR